jgi:integrase
MASRPRSVKKRGWPDGLYERGGYFSWRNPLNGKEMGIGRVTLGEAKAQAAEANVVVAGMRDKPRLADRLLGREDNNLGAWLTEYEKKLAERDLAKNTRKVYKAMVKLAREVYAEALPLQLDKVTTRIIADGLKAVKATRARSAQALRSRLIDAFDCAIADGWTMNNPARITEEPVVKVKRARLTWEVFKAAYDSMPPGRLKNGCALALVTGQPRESIVAALFSDVGDLHRPGGQAVECWKTTRGKTKAKIAIPLSLRLEVFGMSLREVIRQCRATGVASRYMVHTTERRGSAKLGSPMPADQLSIDFTAVIEALGIDWGDKTPPTFHEIRSLSKRLYKDQGGVDTKDLLGHATEAMGDLYADTRGAEYTLVAVA